MNPVNRVSPSDVNANIVQKLDADNTTEKITRGQRLADKLASQVGSWGFLIGQSAVLAGWVGLNVMPGVPHWDESPFMMLNLVFSFASAYTAPVVLMSQNRQSEIDRKKAEKNHKVNLESGQHIELLHEKLDDLHSKQLEELTLIIKQQQQTLNELRVSLVPASKAIKQTKVSLMPGLNFQINSDQFPKMNSANKPFDFTQPIGDNHKVTEKLVRSRVE
ncbi:MAG: DUF1003 domain-containing protein [Desmonostoc vinosum HA7617-LM4]|jgi:uncharacterized membrane protein|nr:DUF1003 domain-containing protein [Desmonostoc vinosum HA7617-LM4]